MTRKVLPATVLGLFATLAGPQAASAGTEDGSCLENFALRNFQPKSPTSDQVVKSSSYRPRATLVVLLASY